MSAQDENGAVRPARPGIDQPADARPRRKDFELLTAAEFIVWIGVVFLNGTCPRRTLTHLWSDEPGLSHPIIAATMKRSRSVGMEERCYS